MIIDKKGKLFGVINLLDLLIVAIVVFVLIFAWLFFVKGGSESVNDLNLTYTIEVVEQEPVYFDHIIPGEPVVNGQTKTPMGTIVSVETYPSELVETNAAGGAYSLQELPGKMSGRITIASDTAEAAYPDLSFDNESIKIGKKLALRSSSAAMQGYIVAIDFNKEAFGGSAQ